MFSKQLIDYTESTFKEEHITIRTKTMVKNVTDKYIEAESIGPDGKKQLEKIPYGLLVWATGNALRPVFNDRAESIAGGPDKQTVRDLLQLLLAIWADRFSFDVFVRHILNHCLGADGDMFLLEGGFSVVDELFGEHGEDLDMFIY